MQQADSDHPYGYSNMKYVASLISGVGIFCVGTGLSFYHGVTGLLNPTPTESFYWVRLLDPEIIAVNFHVKLIIIRSVTVY